MIWFIKMILVLTVNQKGGAEGSSGGKGGGCSKNAKRSNVRR